MIINYDKLAFICKPCGEGKHAECPEGGHCDCQHRGPSKSKEE